MLRIAVTGASGQAGGEVVRLLAAEQTHQVVALSRRGLPLVSRADVARCLAALAVAPASGRDHDITGPESLGLATGPPPLKSWVNGSLR